MKKNPVVLFLVSVLFMMSCGNEKPAEVKREVVIVPAATLKDPPKKPTNISLDKNGVKVETKKVDVSVKKQ